MFRRPEGIHAKKNVHLKSNKPMPPSLRIQVDDRERNENLLKALREMNGLEVESIRLEIGDFRIEDTVLIERKTSTDFAASLIDGRLFSQASRMVQSPLRPAYIIEGSVDEWKSLKVKRPALQGALVSLMLIFDIPVLRSNDPGETARLIYFTGQQLLRAREAGWVPSRQIKAKRRSTRQRRVLQSLPGIGPDRAKRLLEHFGSVRACLTADAESLATIPGIGPTTAQKIIDTIQESRGCYGLVQKSQIL
jgi:DNA excision repair protein ERCC-4